MCELGGPLMLDDGVGKASSSRVRVARRARTRVASSLPCHHSLHTHTSPAHSDLASRVTVCRQKIKKSRKLNVVTPTLWLPAVAIASSTSSDLMIDEQHSPAGLLGLDQLA